MPTAFDGGMNRGMEAMNGRIVKRYRFFERRFDPSLASAGPVGAEIYPFEPGGPATA